MSTLIALVSSGKGSWGQINNLLKLHEWEKVYLVCNQFSYEKFETQKQNHLKLKYDENNPQQMFEKLSQYFKKEVKDFEVALNISSGSGMEHMSLVSSLLKAGLGIRFIYADYGEIKEFELVEKVITEDEENLF